MLEHAQDLAVDSAIGQVFELGVDAVIRLGKLLQLRRRLGWVDPHDAGGDDQQLTLRPRAIAQPPLITLPEDSRYWRDSDFSGIDQADTHALSVHTSHRRDRGLDVIENGCTRGRHVTSRLARHPGSAPAHAAACRPLPYP